MNSNSATLSKGTAIQRAEQYRLPFGRHKDQSLQQIEDKDPTYISRCMAKHPELFDQYPSLREALVLHLQSHLRQSRMSENWHPPSLASAHARFRDQFRSDIWITSSDACGFFHVRYDVLSLLQEAAPIDRFGLALPRYSNTPKYWLYHVWALVRYYISKEDADRGLWEFERRNRRVERDQIASLGPPVSN